MRTKCFLSKSTKIKIYGCIFLLSTISFTAFLYRSIQDHFIISNKPDFLAYFMYSFKIIFFLIYFLKEKIKKRFNNQPEDTETILNKTTYEFNLDYLNDDTFSDYFERIQIYKKKSYEINLCKIIFSLILLNLIPTFFFLYGVLRTCKCNQFILINLCTLFILLENFLIYRGKFNKYNFISLLILYLGVYLFHNSNTVDDNIGSFDLTGNIFIFIAVFFYSLYLNVLKYYSKTYDHFFDIIYIYGYIGLYALIFLPIGIIFLSLLNIEQLYFPKLQEMESMLIISVLSIVNDLLISKSIILLSPQLISSGINLYYPLIITIKLISGEINFDYYYLSGLVLIICSFLIFFYDHFRV